MMTFGGTNEAILCMAVLPLFWRTWAVVQPNVSAHDCATIIIVPQNSKPNRTCRIVIEKSRCVN